jgi:hypothetical protein
MTTWINHPTDVAPPGDALLQASEVYQRLR